MIFSESATNYSLQVKPILSPEELNSGLWLVMAGVDDIPPHIALINEGLYYSVSAKKVDHGTPLENFLKAISRKSTPTIFIRFRLPALHIVDLSKIFKNYPTLGNTIQHSTFSIQHFSCLWPIRDFFAKTFSEKYSKASLVFELLAMAEKDGLIAECKSLFLDSAVEGMVTLPKYTHEQIREKINSILKVNG